MLVKGGPGVKVCMSYYLLPFCIYVYVITYPCYILVPGMLVFLVKETP